MSLLNWKRKTDTKGNDAPRRASTSMDKELKEQDRLLSKAKAAEEAFSEDKDKAKLIKA